MSKKVEEIQKNTTRKYERKVPSNPPPSINPRDTEPYIE
jgi:hypothetical protein